VPLALRPLPTVRPSTLLAGARAVRDLRALLSARRIRLVHAHGSRGALYAGLAARRSRIPVIWHVRIVDRDPWLDGLLLRLSSAIVANSAAAAGRFRGRSGAGTKVHIVPNGVDLEMFSPGPPATTPAPPAEGAVVYLGRLEHGKGPDVFLEAARVVQRALHARRSRRAHRAALRRGPRAGTGRWRPPLRRRAGAAGAETASGSPGSSSRGPRSCSAWPSRVGAKGSRWTASPI